MKRGLGCSGNNEGPGPTPSTSTQATVYVPLASRDPSPEAPLMHVMCSGEGVFFPIDDELAIDTVQGGAGSGGVTDHGVVVHGPPRPTREPHRVPVVG